MHRSDADQHHIFDLTNLWNCAIINKSPVERTPQEKRQKPHRSVIFGVCRRTQEGVGVKERASKDIRENEKLLKKLFKNLLTNSKRCGIINKLSERRELNRANEAKAVTAS